MLGTFYLSADHFRATVKIIFSMLSPIQCTNRILLKRKFVKFICERIKTRNFLIYNIEPQVHNLTLTVFCFLRTNNMFQSHKTYIVQIMYYLYMYLTMDYYLAQHYQNMQDKTLKLSAVGFHQCNKNKTFKIYLV